MLTGCSSKFSNPKSDLEISDLVGVWTAHYSPNEIDMITIDADGNFTQLYKNVRKDYIFDSEKQQISLEKLAGGAFHLHLPGARYYLEGTSVATGNTPLWKISFYDPFADDFVEMVDELILVILTKPDGTLILHHLWTSSDRGFLLFDANSEIFYRN